MNKESITVEMAELKAGKVFIVGEKQFVVLEQLDGATRVILNGVIEEHSFDEDSNDWSKSNIREYLNTEVLKEYESLFGEGNILESETDLTSLDGLDTYGTSRDKIRLLTFDERRKYQKLYKHSKDWEWLATPWSTTERDWKYAVCCVTPFGCVGNDSCYIGNVSVRPVCILKSSIFVSVEE